MPYDVIFYGLMAVIFIAIMVASAMSRMTKREDDRGGGKSGTDRE